KKEKEEKDEKQATKTSLPGPVDTVDYSQSLLERYRPYFYFDEAEQYYPCLIEDYIKNADLVYNVQPQRAGNSPYIMPVLPAGSLTQEKLMTRSNAEWQADLKDKYSNISLGLVPDEAFKKGPENWKESAGVYARMFKTTIREKKGEIKELFAFVYILAYAYNNPNTACACCFKDREKIEGWHYGDLENIVVYVENNAGNPGKIYKVFYDAHGSGEGEWVPSSKVPIQEETHPVVYVAQGSHAHYKKPGTFCRIAFCCNDVISPGKAQVWKPRVISNPEDLKIFDRQGLKFGLDSVDTYKSYFQADHRGLKYSTTGFMRLCCLCLDSKIFMNFDHEILSRTFYEPEKENPFQTGPMLQIMI
ncbi:MAG: Vps62-related protein, partial [Gammaproteobacteria bacterium]